MAGGRDRKDALARIEAALQAGLAGGGDPESARRALGARQADVDDDQIAAWLEAVAAELQSCSAALVPDEMVETIAADMRANRGRSLRAHARVDGGAVRNLIRKG